MEKLIDANPNELRFMVRTDRDDVVQLTLKAVHPGAAMIAYKLKTTKPERYLVNPALGVIPQGETVRVAIALRRMDAPPPDVNKCKNKFQLQAVPLESGSALAAKLTQASPTLLSDINELFGSPPEELAASIAVQTFRCFLSLPPLSANASSPPAPPAVEQQLPKQPVLAPAPAPPRTDAAMAAQQQASEPSARPSPPPPSAPMPSPPIAAAPGERAPASASSTRPPPPPSAASAPTSTTAAASATRAPAAPSSKPSKEASSTVKGDVPAAASAPLNAKPGTAVVPFSTALNAELSGLNESAQIELLRNKVLEMEGALRVLHTKVDIERRAAQSTTRATRNGIPIGSNRHLHETLQGTAPLHTLVMLCVAILAIGLFIPSSEF